MRKPIAPSEPRNGDERSVPGTLPEVRRRRRWPENFKVVGNTIRRYHGEALSSRNPTVHVAPPGDGRNTVDRGPEVLAPASPVLRSTGGVGGDGGWSLGFWRMVSPNLALVWAEVAGKRLNRLRQQERESDEASFGDLRRFPTKSTP